jgi:putative peptide zinc metalloprotease protein
MSGDNGKVEVLWPDEDDVVPLGLGQTALPLDRFPPVITELSAEWAIPAPPPPTQGWRRLLHLLLGGAIDIPPGAKELRRRELVAQIRTPVAGCRKIAFVSCKGGVGKTTTCLLAGHTFASLRGDRVVALDATPDSGTLGHRLRLEGTKTAATLARDRELIGTYADVREYTSQAPSRLEVVVGDDAGDALDGAEVRSAVELLEQHFNLVCLDTAPGRPGATTSVALTLADQIVIVASAALDAARASDSTLDWLEQHGHAQLAASAITALNGIRHGRRGRADVDRIEAHFTSRCRACVRIPWDPLLGTGADAALERLRPVTREAFLELAAVIAHGFLAPTEGRSSP